MFLNQKFNHLTANSTKWSNTLRQFVGCCRWIVWVCLTILWGWRLIHGTAVKMQNSVSSFIKQWKRKSKINKMLPFNTPDIILKASKDFWNSLRKTSSASNGLISNKPAFTISKFLKQRINPCDSKKIF